MELHLVHTAQSHCETFDRLRDEISPRTQISHHVREDWLSRARLDQGDDLRADILGSLKDLEGPILCTCSTIGPIAEEAGALRIDWPMMQAAARRAGPVLLVYCLNSTLQPSLILLRRAMAELDQDHDITCLELSERWPLFEAGQFEPFADALAADVAQVMKQLPKIAAVVLAQASMASAAPRLSHLKSPVLSSPRLAFEALLKQSKGKVS